MATKTFYVLGTAAASPSWNGNLQDGGSAPSDAACTFGYAPGKLAISSYCKSRLGASATATVTSTTSFVAAVGITVGTGATNTTAGDTFSPPSPYTGTFASGNWTFVWNLRAGTAGLIGRLGMRVWASVNANGSSARELTSGEVFGSTVTLSTTVNTNSGITWAAPAITLNNEYLFFQLEYQEQTSAGSSNSDNALFRVGSSIVTTNFATLHQGAALIAGAGGGQAFDVDQRMQAQTLLAGSAAVQASVRQWMQAQCRVSPITALLHFDGSFVDSGGPRTWTQNGAGVSISTAQSVFGGSSMYLDGTSDLRGGGDPILGYGTGDFTIDFRVMLDGAITGDTVLSQTAAAPLGQLYIVAADGFLRYFGTGGVGVSIVGSTVVTPNVWHHVALTRARSVDYLFLDGVLQGSAADPNNYIFQYPWEPTIGSSGSGFVKGWIDEARFCAGKAAWTSNFTPPTSPYTDIGALAVDASPVKCLYAWIWGLGSLKADATISAAPAGTTWQAACRIGPSDDFQIAALGSPAAALLHFDGANGSTVVAVDDSPYSGSTRTWVIAGAPRIDTAQSKFGGSSCNFATGSDQIYTVDTGLPPGTGDFTYDFWVRRASVASASSIIMQMLGRVVTIDSNRALTLVDNATSLGVVIQGANGQVVDDTWHHIAVTRSGTDNRLFLNGVQQGSTWTDAYNYVAGGYRTASLGGMTNGWIDEFRFVKGVAFWTSNFTPPTQQYAKPSGSLAVAAAQLQQARIQIGSALPASATLLHFDGANGSTAFVDNNNSGRTWTPTGTTHIDTAQSVFGGSSVSFPVSSDLRGNSDPTLAIGLGDFTIDFWVQLAAAPSAQQTRLVSISSNETATIGTDFFGSAYLTFNTQGTIQIFGTPVSANVWHHVAVTRASGTTRLFLDGVIQGTWADSTNYTCSSGSDPILWDSTNSTTAWFDEFRYLVGSAAWTSNFTPPTQPYVGGGAGALAAAATTGTFGTIWNGAALLAGAGAVAVDAYAQYETPGVTLNLAGALQLVGAGALVVDATVSGAAHTAWDGATRLVGAGALAANANQRLVDTAIFIGAAAFAGKANQLLVDAAIIAGLGAFTGKASQTLPVGSLIVGAGAFAVNANQLLVDAAQVAGVATRTSLAVLSMPVAAGFFGSATLAVDATSAGVQSGATLITGLAAFNSASLQWVQVRTLLSGAGSLVGVANQTALIGSTHAGIGAVAVNANQLLVDAATFAGLSAITGTAAQSIPVADLIAGSGALAVSSIQSLAGTTKLLGAGAFVGSAIMPNMHAAATFVGAGSITGDLLKSGLNAGAALIAGIGSVAASAGMPNMHALELLSGAGAVAVNVNQMLAANGLLSGAGLFRANTSQTIPVAALVAGFGFVAATPYLNMPAQCAQLGAGTVVSSAGIVSTISARLTGVGALTADTSTAGTAFGNALLTGTGVQTALALIRLAASSRLAATGTLTTDALSYAFLTGERFNGVGALRGNVTQFQVLGVGLTGVGQLSATITRYLILTDEEADGVGTMRSRAIQIAQVASISAGAGGLLVDVFPIGKQNIVILFGGNGRFRCDALIHHNDNASIKVRAGDKTVLAPAAPWVPVYGQPVRPISVQNPPNQRVIGKISGTTDLMRVIGRRFK